MMKASPVERVAGLAFFAFTLMQVPFMIVETNLAAAGLVQLAPLQVSAASVAQTFPRAFWYLQDVLTPGTWVREALSPALRCAVKTSGRGPCARELGRLGDIGYVRNGTNLPLLIKLLDGGGLGAGQTYIVYGCGLITVSALFALYYSVKTAVVGFVLLAYGIYVGDHLPLPPAVLMAFLCVYAGFQLGEVRGNMRGGRQGSAAAGAGRQVKGAVVKPMPSSSSGASTPANKGMSGKAKQRKQRNHA